MARKKRKYCFLTPAKKNKFLKILAETGNISESSKAININRNHMVKIRERDKPFSELWDQAINVGVDTLESEARRRAYNGVDEPVFYRGDICGTIKKYSDTLLIVLLKANRPEKYQEKYQLGVPSNVKGSIKFEMILDGKNNVQGGADPKPVS